MPYTLPMFDYYPLIRPVIFRMDPEKAHEMTLKALKSGLAPSKGAYEDPILETTLWGLKFPNPVGLAAGFDKNAEVIGPAFKMGFGFVEAGTVTPKPQHGNPQPRIFRDPEHRAVINRMGFPNGGMNAFAENVQNFLSQSPRPKGVLGINIGMNKSQKSPEKDYAVLIRKLAPMADYMTINISSPNTPGLRDLQETTQFLKLMSYIKEEREKTCGNHPPPLLVKLAPDLTEEQREQLAEAALKAGIDGLILSNTTLSRPIDKPSAFTMQSGGLSGEPLEELSTQIIHDFYRLTKGKIPIIGVGGVSSGRDAFRKIKAGASLVQIYSTLVFQGPSVPYSINRDLADLLKADGFSSIEEAVGSQH